MSKEKLVYSSSKWLLIWKFKLTILFYKMEMVKMNNFAMLGFNWPDPICKSVWNFDFSSQFRTGILFQYLKNFHEKVLRTHFYLFPLFLITMRVSNAQIKLCVAYCPPVSSMQLSLCVIRRTLQLALLTWCLFKGPVWLSSSGDGNLLQESRHLRKTYVLSLTDLFPSLAATLLIHSLNQQVRLELHARC